VKTILDNGAPLTLMGRICQDKHGPVHGHAIHAAIFYGKNKILHKLLESHPELIEDKFIPSQESPTLNFTPVLLAISVSGDKVEILKTLLNHGALFDNQNQYCKTAIIRMMEHDNAKCFDYLVHLGKIKLMQQLKGKRIAEIIKILNKPNLNKWLIKHVQWLKE
jgi:ankyrin repeat protein